MYLSTDNSSLIQNYVLYKLNWKSKVSSCKSKWNSLRNNFIPNRTNENIGKIWKCLDWVETFSETSHQLEGANLKNDSVSGAALSTAVTTEKSQYFTIMDNLCTIFKLEEKLNRRIRHPSLSSEIFFFLLLPC